MGQLWKLKKLYEGEKGYTRTYVCNADGGEITPCTSTLLACIVDGYTLHVHTGIHGLNVHTTDDVDGYTLHLTPQGVMMDARILLERPVNTGMPRKQLVRYQNFLGTLLVYFVIFCLPMVAKLVARLLATAALWVCIQTSLKNTSKEWSTHSSTPNKT